MIKVIHRRNTIEQLKTVNPEYGVEIDIRSEGSRLILHHDAFEPGTDFEKWLESYRHQLLILNTKAEGLEVEILNLMHQFKVENYFFLDMSIPFMIKWMSKGLKNIAVRFSEYEPLDFVLKFSGKVDWVWIDCFTDLHLNKEEYQLLKNHFKLCLVSPELQAHPTEKIQEFKSKLQDMPMDAVCTKFPELW